MIRTIPKQRNRRGVILPLIALLSIFLMVMIVFFVDVAYMQLTRTQLQAATDAAAKAGCEAIDSGATEAEIKQAAITVAAMNEVAGQPLILEASDIVLGASSEEADGSWNFQDGGTPVNAVRVVGAKTDDKPSGSVPLFFAGFLGVHKFSPTEDATATQFEHEVVLVADRSHSMAFDFSGNDWSYPGNPNAGYDPDTYCNGSPDVGSRWTALSVAVNSFLDICEANGTSMQQRVGLVTWASAYSGCAGVTYPAARLESPLGFNFTGIKGVMAGLNSGPLPGGTNMSAGLDAGITELTGPNSSTLAKKTLILFTDGQWNTGPDPATRVTAAQNNNITIHVVSLLGNLDPAEMDALASATGGIHYQASTPQELLDAFNALARSLPVVLTK